MATLGEPKFSIQERINIISANLVFCTSSIILLIIYLHCLIGLYFNVLFTIENSTTTTYIPCHNSTCWGLGPNSTYDDDSFSL